jgi:hypothetical protein
MIGDRRGAMAEWRERQMVGAGIEVRARRLGDLLRRAVRYHRYTEIAGKRTGEPERFRYRFDRPLQQRFGRRRGRTVGGARPALLRCATSERLRRPSADVRSGRTPSVGSIGKITLASVC